MQPTSDFNLLKQCRHQVAICKVKNTDQRMGKTKQSTLCPHSTLKSKTYPYNRTVGH